MLWNTDTDAPAVQDLMAPFPIFDGIPLAYFVEAISCGDIRSLRP